MAEENTLEEMSQEKRAGEDGDKENPFVIETVSAPEQEVEPSESASERVEGKYTELLSKVSSTSAQGQSQHDADVPLDAKGIGDTLDEDSKIQKLLDLAETKGVVHAVKVARSLKDYYALDKMHDELADKLYEGLVSRGMLEKSE